MKKINKIISGVLLSLPLLLPNTVLAASKTETVYANLNYNGKGIKSTVVNKLMYNGEEKIEDETELKKILNINGDENYKLEGNTLIWKTNKKDIYYQGTTEKELPITVNIKYYLDGQKISAKKLKGKKGDVKVVIDFKNNSVSTYQGKKIYTPFVVTAGTIMDGSNNTNIEVNNGRVIDTGIKSMLVAIASPGLYESIGIEQMKSLNQISFSYHTDKFSQENIYIVATPKLLDNEDLNVFDKIDASLTKINKLQNGTNELETGSNTLANGTNTLKNELGNKINELKNSDNSGVGSIAKNKVVNQLNSNLNTLVQNTIYNVVKTKVNATKDNIINNTIQTNCASLYGTSNYEMCVEGVKSNVTTETIMNYYNAPTYSEIVTGLNQVINYYISNGGIAPTEENKNLATLISYQVSGILSTTDYAKYILNENIYNAYIIPTFNSVFNGVVSSYGSIASSVAVETTNQATNLTLSSLDTMYDAISKIDEGASKISSGINELNQSGIKVLSNVVNQYKNYSEVIKELKKLSKNYKGFASNNSNNIKFIYKIKAIK